jgi:hypothetical protein
MKVQQGNRFHAIVIAAALGAAPAAFAEPLSAVRANVYPEAGGPASNYAGPAIVKGGKALKVRDFEAPAADGYAGAPVGRTGTAVVESRVFDVPAADTYAGAPSARAVPARNAEGAAAPAKRDGRTSRIEVIERTYAN